MTLFMTLSMSNDTMSVPGDSSGARHSRGNATWFAANTGIMQFLIVACLVCVLVADLGTPHGVDIWVFYLVAILAAFLLWHPLLPACVSLVVIVLLSVGYELSRPGLQPGLDLLNRQFVGIIALLLGAAGYFFIRSKLFVSRQNWLRNAENGLAERIAGQAESQQVAKAVVSFLAEYLHAQFGVFYLASGNEFHRAATYGVGDPATVPEIIQAGEGAIGESIADGGGRLIHDGHFSWGSSRADKAPKSVVIAPMLVDGDMFGAIELGLSEEGGSEHLELIELVSQVIGLTLRSCRDREQLRSANAKLTGEMRLREELHASRIQSQRMEAIGQLAGGIAHDFNNLLGIIAGNLELADSRITDNTAKRHLRYAVDAVTVGSSLNRRLLSFSSRGQLVAHPVNLNERVSEVLPLLQRTLGAQFAMSTTLDRDLWLTDVDPGEVDHALINLALNARDAMPDGGKLAISSCNISLDAEAAARLADAHPGDYVQLTLTDTGQGMPAEVLARAVEPFFTTKEGKGSGLGLSSVHGFCKQSGGFLSISSAVGQGTAVSIHLPKSSFRVTPDLARPAAQQIPTGDGELILVVEDNNELREIASSYLESLDYTVLEARDGSDAIKILETEEPVALVFSDVVMPGGVSGYDIAKWLETHKHKAKIVLTSGYNDVDRTARGIDGEIVLLGKPYNREQLAREVHAALRRA